MRAKKGVIDGVYYGRWFSLHVAKSSFCVVRISKLTYKARIIHFFKRMSDETAHTNP